MNCILAKIAGKQYPVVESAVYADGCTTKITVSLVLDPNHVDLDSPQYIETKWRKQIPALDSIGITRDAKTEEQAINVTMSVSGKHNSMDDLKTLEKMAITIAKLAEDRLSEPSVIKAIGEDCKPWFEEDDNEESNHESE